MAASTGANEKRLRHVPQPLMQSVLLQAFAQKDAPTEKTNVLFEIGSPPKT
jgi:hypothetical protein